MRSDVRAYAVDVCNQAYEGVRILKTDVQFVPYAVDIALVLQAISRLINRLRDEEKINDTEV
ncbi:MAG: hypothetical protein ACREJN_21555 [Nitrospiraceae bacterium]